MRFKRQYVLLFLFFFSFASFGKESFLKIGFSKEQKRILKEDLSFLENQNWKLSTSETKILKSLGIFKKQFSFFQYVKERIHVFFTPKVPFNEIEYYAQSRIEKKVYARNQTLGFVLTSLMYPKAKIQLKIPIHKNKVLNVPIEVFKKGMVVLEKNYFNEPFLWKRVAVLVHEARHSDCSRRGEISKFLIKIRNLKDRKKRLKAFFKKIRNFCGFFHKRCPARHPYHGLYACDPSAKGAETVEMVFFWHLWEHAFSEIDKWQKQRFGEKEVMKILPLWKLEHNEEMLFKKFPSFLKKVLFKKKP